MKKNDHKVPRQTGPESHDYNYFAQHLPPEMRPGVDMEFVKRWDKEIYKEASEMYITGCNYARHSFGSLIKKMLNEAGIEVQE